MNKRHIFSICKVLAEHIKWKIIIFYFLLTKNIRLKKTDWVHVKCSIPIIKVKTTFSSSRISIESAKLKKTKTFLFEFKLEFPEQLNPWNSTNYNLQSFFSGLMILYNNKTFTYTVQRKKVTWKTSNKFTLKKTFSLPLKLKDMN